MEGRSPPCPLFLSLIATLHTYVLVHWQTWCDVRADWNTYFCLRLLCGSFVWRGVTRIMLHYVSSHVYIQFKQIRSRCAARIRDRFTAFLSLLGPLSNGNVRRGSGRMPVGRQRCLTLKYRPTPCGFTWHGVKCRWKMPLWGSLRLPCRANWFLPYCISTGFASFLLFLHHLYCM